MRTIVARRILASLTAIGLFVVGLQGSSAAAEPEPLGPGRPVSVETLPAPLWLPGTERARRQLDSSERRPFEVPALERVVGEGEEADRRLIHAAGRLILVEQNIPVP
jgi:hypothetical protein